MIGAAITKAQTSYQQALREAYIATTVFGPLLVR
jgi:hypothetical protein